MILDKFLKYLKKPKLCYFNVNLVDHCNLNCKYCDHFSPISEEKYVNIKDLERDFKRISSLVSIYSVGLMGGEPLLHPQLPEILKMSRRVLPKTRLRIYTNGILLNQQPEIFWETCRDYNIAIAISRYPIKLDLKTIYNTAIKYKVDVKFYDGTLHKFKTMFKLAFDMEGKQDPNEMSRICWQNKGGCSYFGDGKLYQCTTAGHIHRLSKYFNLNLYPTEEDYVDIYKVKSGWEIIDYYKKVLPFCKYCDIKNQVSNLEFEISKKELSEWT